MWTPSWLNFHGSGLSYVTVIGPLKHQEAEANGSQEEFQTVSARHGTHYTLTSRNKRAGVVQWLGALAVLLEDLGSIPSTHMVAHTSLHGNFSGGGRSRSTQALTSYASVLPADELPRDLWFPHHFISSLKAILWIQLCRSWGTWMSN